MMTGMTGKQLLQVVVIVAAGAPPSPASKRFDGTSFGGRFDATKPSAPPASLGTKGASLDDSLVASRPPPSPLPPPSPVPPPSTSPASPVSTHVLATHCCPETVQSADVVHGSWHCPSAPQRRPRGHVPPPKQLSDGSVQTLSLPAATQISGAVQSRVAVQAWWQRLKMQTSGSLQSLLSEHPCARLTGFVLWLLQLPALNAVNRADPTNNGLQMGLRR